MMVWGLLAVLAVLAGLAGLIIGSVLWVSRRKKARRGFDVIPMAETTETSGRAVHPERW